MNKYVFDLDNTLIYTDNLNNLSYNHALNQVGLSPINNCKRITRNVVFNKYPYLSNIQKSKIINLKQEYFVNNLKTTIPNTQLLQLLKIQNAESCLLWTNASKDRVSAMLKYYQIINAFKTILFSNKLDVKQDIIKICNILKCNLEHLIFYEDNLKVVQALQQNKINVIHVR